MKYKYLLLSVFIYLFSATVSAQCPVNSGFYKQTNNNQVSFSSKDTNKLYTTYTWNFGDGTTGKGKYTNHTYKKTGTYKVCHYVYYANPNTRKKCVDSTCATVTVKYVCNLNANFTYSNKGMNYKFYSPDSSSRHYWYVSNGNKSYNTQSPTHTFTKAGTYVVCHTASYYDSSKKIYCYDSICKNIVVKNACNASAYFTTTKDKNNPNTYHFSALRKQFLHKWTINGSTKYGDKITYNFQKAGTYKVCHIAKAYDSLSKTYCYDTLCTSLTVGNKCHANANFTYVRDSLNPNKITFKSLVKNNSRYWKIGTLTKQGHTTTVDFKYTGTYNVCHYASYYDSSTRKTCYDTVCKSVIIKSKCNANAQYTYSRDTNNPSIYYFSSLRKQFLHKWTINGSTKYGDKITYNFQKAGTYNVCHIAKAYDSSTRTYCYDTLCHKFTVGSKCQANASFTYKVDPNNSNKITFTGTSTHGSHYWTIGSIGRQGRVTTVDFKYAGTYNICHYVSVYDSINRSYCTDTICKSIVIKSNGCNVSGKFSYKVSSGKTVQFTTLHPNAKNHWRFQQGKTSTKANPSYTFPSYGTYWVCHAVEKYDSSQRKWCVDSVCQYVIVKAPCHANAAFAFKANGLNASFYDQQPNASHKYTFGDGTSSYKSNPTHTYKKDGTYTVCHYITVFDSLNRTYCKDTLCKKITVKGSNCSADYSVVDSSGTKYFRSNDRGAHTSHVWTFGDGYASYLRDPAHKYKSNGTYKVCHAIIVKNLNGVTICSDTTCKYVTVGGVKCNANFSVTNSNGTYTFKGVDFGNNIQYQWTFGNGKHGASRTETTTYNKTGTYKVCLVVTKHDINKRQICSDTICKMIKVQHTSTEDLNKMGSLSLFPNPVNKTLTINSELNRGGNASIKVLNVIGQEVVRTERVIPSGTHKTTLNVEALDNGIYFLVIQSSQGKLVQKFVKK